MGTVYRKTVTKSLPQGAEIVTGKGGSLAGLDKADVLAAYLVLSFLGNASDCGRRMKARDRP